MKRAGRRLAGTAMVVAGLATPFAVSPGQAQPAAAATVEVVASRSGFRPASLTLRRGETVRLMLRSADGEHCFAIDALRIEKRIVPERSTRFDLTPERTGVFVFHCCLESGEAARIERGKLTVSSE